MAYCAACLQQFDDSQAKACPRCGAPLPSPDEATKTSPAAGSGLTLDGTSGGAHELGDHTVLPASIGRFIVIRELGSGSFGCVYLARDPQLDRHVALKVLRSDRLVRGNVVERFRREARSASRLKHPGIVTIYSVDQDGDDPFIVCEYVEGMTLGQFAATNQLSFPQIAQIVRDVALALDYAHSQEIVHRDVKPENILVERSGRPRLADFGLAKRPDDIKLTADGQIVGTPAYMSPEQATGHHTIGPASDIYSLGVVLYVLLTGELPFRGKLPMVIRQVARDLPRSLRSLNDAIPVDLETICQKAMEKEPAKRYRTGNELADDLDRWLSHRPIKARHIGPAGRLIRWGKRNPALSALTVTVAALLILVAGVSSYLFVREYRALSEKFKLLNAQYVSHGTSLFEPQRPLDTSNPLASLPWLMAGLETDVRDADRETRDRIRIGLTLRASPKVAQMYFQDAPIKLATFNPAGTRVLTVERGSEAQIWETKTGKPVGPPLRHAGDVCQGTFSPDGKLVATCATDGTTGLWDAMSGQPICEPLRQNSSQKASPVLRLCFSPEGNFLATVDEAEKLRIWDIPPAPEHAPKFMADGVLRAQFSRDGKYLVTADGAGYTATVRELTTGKTVATFDEHKVRRGHVHVVAWGGDDNTIASGDTSGQVFVWNPLAGTETHKLPPHVKQITAIGFNFDGSIFATASSDGAVKIWRTADAQQIGSTITHGGAVNALEFAPRRDLLATSSADGLVGVWDSLTGKAASPPLVHADQVTSVAFSPQESYLLTASFDGPARLWDYQPRLLTSSPHLLGTTAECANASRDGTYFAVTQGPVITIGPSSNPSAAATLRGHLLEAKCVCFSSDNAILASGSADRTARLWRVADQQPIGNPLVHDALVNKVEVARDGKRLLTLTRKEQVFLWDADSSKCLKSPVPHPGRVSDIAICADGSQFATVGESATCLWRLDNGAPIGEPLVETDLTPRSVTFGPKHAWFLTIGRQGATLWKSASHGFVHQPLVRNEAVSCSAADDSGDSFAIISASGTAQIWDAQTETPTSPAMHHPGPVSRFAFSASGGLLATYCEDRALRLWDTKSGLLLAPPIAIAEEVHSISFCGSSAALYCFGVRYLYSLTNIRPDRRSFKTLSTLNQCYSAHKFDVVSGSIPLRLAELRDVWLGSQLSTGSVGD
jgi:eukaryotic-like serine/threonine-protein kinase